MESKEGFVKYGSQLGNALSNKQEQEMKQNPEEINLVHKIELRTENLLKDLNSIESLTNALNKMLLPLRPKMESEAKKAEERPPQGWLENHLQGLDFAIRRSGQIYEQVTRLMQATKINVK